MFMFITHYINGIIAVLHISLWVTWTYVFSSQPSTALGFLLWCCWASWRRSLSCICWRKTRSPVETKVWVNDVETNKVKILSETWMHYVIQALFWTLPSFSVVVMFQMKTRRRRRRRRGSGIHVCVSVCLLINSQLNCWRFGQHRSLNMQHAPWKKKAGCQRSQLVLFYNCAI